MEESLVPTHELRQSATPIHNNNARFNSERCGNYLVHGSGFRGTKKMGRSWINISENGMSTVLEVEKATLMKRCSLPARDLRLLDPLFIYPPSTILGREKAIVVSLELIRCIITADEIFLMNSLDGCVGQYESELSKRLKANIDHPDDLPFEFRALELALELTCISFDAQMNELESEIYPVLDELTSSIDTLNLERVRRSKGHLLSLTQRVQKVHYEIEHLMGDDGDMAEMYLTEKKQRSEAYTNTKSAPDSPTDGVHNLQRSFGSGNFSKFGSPMSSSSSTHGENIEQLEMLLEAYFVVIDNILSKLSTLKDYIDDTEVLISLKLGNVQNQLIQFQMLLTAATFLATVFAAVTAVFGMNFPDAIFDYAVTFNWVLIICGVSCGLLYTFLLLYFKHRKIFPL